MADKKVLVLALLAITLLAATGLYAETAPSRARDPLYEARLEKGLFNTEPYSYLLINRAHEYTSRAKEFLNLAKSYSPDLPAVYFELASENFYLSPRGVYEGLSFFVQGLITYFRNFWWSFSFAGLIYVSLMFSLVLSLSVVLSIRLPLDISLFIHDVAENKKMLVSLVVFGFLVFSGPVGYIIGVFSLIGFYFKRRDRALVYISMLFFFLAPLLLDLAGVFMSPPTPSMRAVVAVNEGKDNSYAIENLRGAADFHSLFSYALALKREGHYQEAISIYTDIIKHSRKVDPRLYVNLGNAYYSAGRPKDAEEAYRKSIGIKPLSSAFYNLSQVSREMLDFVKGEEYFNNATRLGSADVSRFTSIAGQGANRFVVDETLDEPDMWGSALSRISPSYVWLINSVLALIAFAVFIAVNRGTKDYARKCRRCGATFCRKCSHAAGKGGMCSKCYTSLTAGGASPKDRVDTILFMQNRQSAKRKVGRLLSFLLPGAGHVYAGEVLSGFLLIWMFSFSVVALAMQRLSFPGLAPFSHAWLVPLMVLFLISVYAISALKIRKGGYKRWL